MSNSINTFTCLYFLNRLHLNVQKIYLFSIPHLRIIQTSSCTDYVIKDEKINTEHFHKQF